MEKLVDVIKELEEQFEARGVSFSGAVWMDGEKDCQSVIITPKEIPKGHGESGLSMFCDFTISYLRLMEQRDVNLVDPKELIQSAMLMVTAICAQPLLMALVDDLVSQLPKKVIEESDKVLQSVVEAIQNGQKVIMQRVTDQDAFEALRNQIQSTEAEANGAANDTIH